MVKAELTWIIIIGSAVQDQDVFQYHVIPKEILFPDHLHDGMLKSTLLGPDHQVQFHLTDNNQVPASFCSVFLPLSQVSEKLSSASIQFLRQTVRATVDKRTKFWNASPPKNEERLRSKSYFPGKSHIC